MLRCIYSIFYGKPFEKPPYLSKKQPVLYSEEDILKGFGVITHHQDVKISHIDRPELNSFPLKSDGTQDTEEIQILKQFGAI